MENKNFTLESNKSCPLFDDAMRISNISFLTHDHFYFDSLSYLMIANECHNEIKIEETVVSFPDAKNVMVFRINLQDFHDYHNRLKNQ